MLRSISVLVALPFLFWHSIPRVLQIYCPTVNFFQFPPSPLRAFDNHLYDHIPHSPLTDRRNPSLLDTLVCDPIPILAPQQRPFDLAAEIGSPPPPSPIPLYQKPYFSASPWALKPSLSSPRRRAPQVV